MPLSRLISGCLVAAILAWHTFSYAQSPFDQVPERITERAAGEVEEEEPEEEEEDEIETDRDSFTPATSVVGCRRFVIESAYSFIENRDVPETHSLPEIVARYGISENVELRFGYNYEVGGAGNPISGNAPDDGATDAEIESEARILYGTKWRLAEQCCRQPQSSIILQGFTPVSGESTDTLLSATYVFGWKLANDWEWDSAIRYGTSSFEEDRFNTWSPSTVLKIPFGEKWKGHAEYFNVSTEGRENETTQHFFSPGAHYLITPNFEFGVRLGWGLNDQSPNFFSNVGGGIRF